MGMSRSRHWESVRSLVVQSRRDSDDFDPAVGDPPVCIEEGVRPIVELYARVRRSEDALSDVERSLLAGVLNDWLRHYAACHDTHAVEEYTVHEVAMAYARGDSLAATLDSLLGLETERQF